MCRALLVAQGRHPTWRTYSARRVAPGRLLVDQAKKSHLGLYTVLSELSANTKLAWRAVHRRRPAIAVAKSPSHRNRGTQFKGWVILHSGSRKDAQSGNNPDGPAAQWTLGGVSFPLPAQVLPRRLGRNNGSGMS